MKKIVLKIEGMSCSACSNGLEKYLNKQDGIISCSVNLVSASALIEYDDKLKLEDLNRFVSEAGFTSLGEYKVEKEEKNNKNKILLIVFAFLIILLMYVSMSHMIGLVEIPFLSMHKHPMNYSICLFILTIPFLIYGIDIFRSGYKNLIHKTPNMDTLVTLGVACSFIYSFYNLIMVLLGHLENVGNLYFESSATIIFFIKLGRFIDKKSKEKTNSAVEGLVQITPESAIVKTKDGEKEVTIDEVKKGDILICKPGSRFAVDGTITKGESHIDESFITGESTLSKKGINDKVIAGSINIDGYVEYKAEKIGKNSTVSEMVKLVVESQNTKAKISLLADKICGYFVPSIILIALLTFFGYLVLSYPFNESLTRFVSVLVVACPCALGLATPLACVISTGVCAKKGILIKSNDVLENACKIDTVVFDKTGTLTYGKLRISKIKNYSKYKDKEIIQIVSSIESKSSHPIAFTFTSYAKDNNIDLLEVTDFKNLSGIGIYAKIKNKEYYIGNNKLFKKFNSDNNYSHVEDELSKDENSIVYVIENNKVIAIIGVKDVVRDNSRKVVSELQKLKIDVIMLSGDNEKTANIIAKSIGIKNVISNVLPKEKTDVIKDLISKNKKVMMVGDGINDAPALESATIGVSISSATDIAASSSSVILINDNLERIVDLINISKKTFRIIKENLFWAFIYNILMIPIAIGLLKPFNLTLNPMLASISMTISSLCVVFNSLRIRNIK